MGTGSRYNDDLLAAMQYPPEGIPIDASGRAKNPKQQTLLDQLEEEEEEEEGKEEGKGEDEREWYEPLDQFPAYGAGLLAAGASMMRQSGWRDTPITQNEMIGHAIPAGMEAYYNQEIMNRQEDADIAEAQNEQRTAEDEAEDELENEQAFLLALNTSRLRMKLPNKEWRELKAYLLGLYKHKPEKAYEILKEISMPKETEKKSVLKSAVGPDGKMQLVHVTEGKDPIWTGLATGEATGLEKEANIESRFVRKHELAEDRLGFDEEQAAIKKSQWTQSFDYKEGEDKLNRNERVRMNEHKILQDGVRNKYTVQQIENQALQHREMAKRRGIEFDASMDLKKAILNFRKESWKKEYNYKEKVDGKTHEQRIKEFEHKIAQDGINNDFTADRIANDIKEFSESMNLKKEHFTKTHKLKEDIFGWQVDDSIKKYNTQKNQFNKTLATTEYRYEKDYKYKVSESARKQGNAKRNYDQGIVEHLALIQQRGKQNEYSEEKIALAQRKFLESQSQYKDDKEFRDLQHFANVENRSAVLAQKLVEYEYKISRDDKGDLRKDTEWKQKLVEYQNKLIQQELGAEHWDKTHELKREIFAADVEHKRLKLTTEGHQAPQTLTGDAAREWAADNPDFELPKQTGMPVLRINKHGEFDSLDWIKDVKYTDSQLSSMARVQEKWMDSPEIRGGRKMVRLARSLRALADNKTGVSEFAMVYKFMKSLDETSTVLASEFRNAREAGLSAFDALELWGDKQFTGKQLDDDQKFEIVEAVRTVAYQRMNDINDMRTSMIDRLVEEGVRVEDAEKMVPNALQGYFDQYPYTGTTGLGDSGGTGGTGELEDMANNKYVPPEATAGRTMK
jgi:hypothetical protein